MILNLPAAVELPRPRISRRSGPGGASSWAVALVALWLLSSTRESTARSASANDGWVGERVVQKYASLELKNQGKVIGPDGIAIYSVEKVNGTELLLKEQGRGVGGWVSADQVVPVGEAIAFFTEYIRTNPDDSHGYMMRATIWHEERHELDIALGDYNEVIRLKPTLAVAYFNRGNLWSSKQKCDRAITDYDEAIRLDPKTAAFYNNRAIARNSKNEFDGAIADFSEAIRLDPKSAIAHTLRGWS
jgi:tetratricopeptide (TPR) repeat protein